MWELIQSNRRKSLALFLVLGFFFILAGYLFGSYYFPGGGGETFVVIAVLIWIILSLTAYYSGQSIVLGLSKAREVTPKVHPQLFNVVEEMRIAANLPSMPKVYIINEEAPNAFATGRNPKTSAIAVTAGLLSRLNRDQLQGVVAHEMSHIVNRDVMFITFAGITLGGIVLISEIFLRSLWYTGGSSRRYSSDSSRGGGQAQLIIGILALVFAILGPLIARLLYFAISRKREYLADASAVRLTRYPEGLASALEKISSSNFDLPVANKVTAPMYIVNPLKKKGLSIRNLTSTHPPISDRVRILRSISGGANYAQYQSAFSKVTGASAGLIPKSSLEKDREKVDIRKEEKRDDAGRDRKTNRRTLGDLMMTVNRFAFITCACGLKLKVPPDYKKRWITCPKCGRRHDLPFTSAREMN